MGNVVLEAIGDKADFVKGIHTQGMRDRELRYIAQFQEVNTIISVNSNYGGNVLHWNKVGRAGASVTTSRGYAS